MAINFSTKIINTSIGKIETPIIPVLLVTAPTTNIARIVKATIDDDIYDLYCYNMDNPYGTAMIPNYKSSVMMNKLFRNIRENFNLDLLEESEDEGEFENTSSDKFVNLDKKINMKCVYIHRFRKWQPIEVIHGKTRLITEKEALFFERK